MGMESPQREHVESDPKLSFESIAQNFTESTGKLDALVAAITAEGGALPPEIEAAHTELQGKILNLQHATAF